MIKEFAKAVSLVHLEKNLILLVCFVTHRVVDGLQTHNLGGGKNVKLVPKAISYHNER